MPPRIQSFKVVFKVIQPPLCPPKWPKIDLMQPLLCKNLNDTDRHPLRKYQWKSSSSWQISSILPLKAPISPKISKETQRNPYRVSTQTTQLGVLYTYINEKLAIVAIFPQYHP